MTPAVHAWWTCAHPTAERQPMTRSKCQHVKSSQYRGVFWNTKSRQWEARLGHYGRSYYLGLYDDEIEAARAYDAEARERHGRRAHPNFPTEAERRHNSRRIANNYVHRTRDNVGVDPLEGQHCPYCWIVTGDGSTCDDCNWSLAHGGKIQVGAGYEDAGGYMQCANPYQLAWRNL